MSVRIQNSRQLLKRTNVSGATPTVNTGSTQHTDGTWTVDEIYAGELYWNMEDIPKKLYLGWEDISGNTGVELIYPSSGSSYIFTGGSGNCIADLYISNLHGCSPINLWDKMFIQTGVTFASADDTSFMSFDSGGLGLINIETQSLGGILHQITMDSNNLAIPFSLKSDDGSVNSQITLSPEGVIIDGGGYLQILVNLPSIGYPTIDFAKTNNRLKHDLGGNGTTNATPIAIGTIDFSGTTDKVITINANVNGIDIIGNKGYGAKLFAVFKNIGGVITQLSTTDKSEKTDFATATSDIVISGTDIIIQVTGELATNINWQTDFSYHITQ